MCQEAVWLDPAWLVPRGEGALGVQHRGGPPFHAPQSVPALAGAGQPGQVCSAPAARVEAPLPGTLLETGAKQQLRKCPRLYVCFATAHVTLLFTHRFALNPSGFVWCLTKELTQPQGNVGLFPSRMVGGRHRIPIASRVSTTWAGAPGCPVEGPASARPRSRRWSDARAAPRPAPPGANLLSIFLILISQGMKMTTKLRARRASFRQS